MSREILNGIAAGDQTAFLAFYNRIARSFLKFLYFRGGRDMDLAWEVFQEAFTRMVHHREELLQLRDDDTLYSWLCGVGKRILADHFRRMSGKRRLVLESSNPGVRAALENADLSEISEEVAGDPQMQRIIGAALHSLRPDYERVLRAKYQKDLSIQEIASRAGESPKVIEARLFRARDAFREAIRAMGVEIGVNYAG